MGRSYGEWTAPLLAAIFEVALWITLLVSRSARKNPGLVGGSIVVILGLASSLLIAFSSYLSNYHILEKQWVFGLALVPLGVTWQVADVLRWCAKWPVYVRWGPGALVVVAVGVALISTLTGQADAIREDRSRMAEILIADEQAHPDLDDPEVVARDPVLMANILALRGGRMPPSFSGLFGLPPTVK